MKYRPYTRPVEEQISPVPSHTAERCHTCVRKNETDCYMPDGDFNLFKCIRYEKEEAAKMEAEKMKNRDNLCLRCRRTDCVTNSIKRCDCFVEKEMSTGSSYPEKEQVVSYEYLKKHVGSCGDWCGLFLKYLSSNEQPEVNIGILLRGIKDELSWHDQRIALNWLRKHAALDDDLKPTGKSLVVEPELKKGDILKDLGGYYLVIETTEGLRLVTLGSFRLLGGFLQQDRHKFKSDLKIKVVSK